MPKTMSRPDRWRAAAGDARAALDVATEALSNLEAALQDLRDVKQEYEDWLDGMPDGLRYSATGEKLQAIVDLDMDQDVTDLLSEVESLVDEAEGADLPLGFGRD